MIKPTVKSNHTTTIIQKFKRGFVKPITHEIEKCWNAPAFRGSRIARGDPRAPQCRSTPAIAAWRDGRRFEQGLERVALADDGMAAIPQGAVCLITGGFGGIGQAIARELASPLRVRARYLTRRNHPIANRALRIACQIIRQCHAL